MLNWPSEEYSHEGKSSPSPGGSDACDLIAYGGRKERLFASPIPSIMARVSVDHQVPLMRGDRAGGMITERPNPRDPVVLPEFDVVSIADNPRRALLH